jgi:hypothetical protein
MNLGGIMMVLRFFKIMSTFVLIGLIIAACSFYSGDKGGNSKNYTNLSDPNLVGGSRMYGSSNTGNIVVHNNTELRYSRGLSNKLTNIPGVRAAIVMITERNAYAAILIDNSVTGTRGPKSKEETNHTGASFGTYDPHTLNQSVENWRLATGINNYETIQNQEDIAAPFKQSIATALRAANPLIHQVFISANRDFINQLTAYAIESDWGEASLNHRLNLFNGTVNRLFGVSDAALEAKH